MRVGIDAHIIGKKKGGVETYLSNLIQALADGNGSQEYVIYVRANAGMTSKKLPPQMQLRVLPVESPWVQRPLLPFLTLRDRLDVLHVQRAIPPYCPVPTVVTIHDVDYRVSPGHFAGLATRMKDRIFEFSAKRATRIQTVSNASRSDILRLYGVEKEKVHVAYNGVDLDRFRPGDVTPAGQLGKQYGIEGPFVLYVGALDRNKNVHGLLRAFNSFKASIPEVKLVICGGERKEAGAGYKTELRSLVQELNLNDRVIFTGYVPDEDVPRLMQRAKLVVFPSFCEGFGLPPVEAMACGTPVVASRLPAVEEVCGDAAILVDPSDFQSIGKAMLDILTSEDLTSTLRSRGIDRARLFSWKTTANIMRTVYDEAAGAHA